MLFGGGWGVVNPPYSFAHVGNCRIIYLVIGLGRFMNSGIKGFDLLRELIRRYHKSHTAREILIMWRINVRSRGEVPRAATTLTVRRIRASMGLQKRETIEEIRRRHDLEKRLKLQRIMRENEKRASIEKAREERVYMKMAAALTNKN